LKLGTNMKRLSNVIIAEQNKLECFLLVHFLESHNTHRWGPGTVFKAIHFIHYTR